MGDTPELLHASEGVRIVRNPKNKMVVCWLYYYADPAKRSKAWEAEARAGLTNAQFEKEFLINFTALFGERVFPEIVENRRKIVVEPPYPDFGKDQAYWGGFDYGARNPSSLHFYTIYDDVIYSVWELFEPCKDVKDFVKKAKEFPHYGRVKYIAADPRIIDSKTTRNRYGNPCTMNELFCEAGFTKLITGDNNEEAWIAQIHRHWADVDNPGFKIFACCPNLVREFESAAYANLTDRMMATQNFRETMIDKDNHGLDACKYFMNSRPRVGQNKIKFARIIDRYRH